MLFRFLSLCTVWNALADARPKMSASEGNFSQLRDKFSRSDSLKDKRVDGWGVIAG